MPLNDSPVPSASGRRSKLLIVLCAASVVFVFAGATRFGYRAISRWREIRRDAAIACSHPIADFGVVAPGTRLVHTFLIQNSGSELATVTSVRPECSSCTDAALQDNEIEPGSFVPLEATLKLDDTAGIISKMIWVTVDKRSRPIALQLKAVVQ